MAFGVDLKCTEQAWMPLGLILREIICGVNEFSLKLRMLPPKVVIALIPFMVVTFAWSFLKKLKKDRHEPLLVQWPLLCSSLMVLDRFGWYRERSQGERPRRQKHLGSNPGSSLTACLVLSTFLNLDPPQSCLCEARVDASVYSSRFLWEMNGVNLRQ